MKFKIFYCLFLVVCLLYSTMPIFGAVQIRHIVTVAMFTTLCIMGEFKMDRFLRMVLLFLFFYGISSIITNQAIPFINKLVGTYLSCVSLYLGIGTMVRRYNSTEWIIYTILGVAIIDSIVTIGQFYNFPLARNITDVLHVMNVEEGEWSQIENYGGAMGRAVGGLLGGVKNGYFLSAAVVLSLYNKEGHIKLYNWILCLFLYISLFMSQERAGFYLGTLSIVAYYVIATSRSRRYRNYIYLLIVLSALLLFGYNYFDVYFNISEMRYGILENDMGGRSELAENAWNYLKDNPMGGALDFFSNGNREPHNFVMNSLLYGGLFGGLVMLFIVLSQLIKCFRIMWLSYFQNKYSLLLVILALIYIEYTINSAFHNSSLVTGTEMFYVWWGLVSSLYYTQAKIRKNRIPIYRYCKSQ